MDGHIVENIHYDSVMQLFIKLLSTVCPSISRLVQSAYETNNADINNTLANEYENYI